MFRLRLALWLRLGGRVVGSVLVATLGSVHRLRLALWLMLRLRLRFRLRLRLRVRLTLRLRLRREGEILHVTPTLPCYPTHHTQTRQGRQTCGFSGVGTT